MIPIDAAQTSNSVGNDFNGGVNLNDLLQQQIVAENGLRSQSGMPVASLEDRCLDLQTGKASPDDILQQQFDDSPIAGGLPQIHCDMDFETADLYEMPSLEMHTRNDSLGGTKHPVTGVPFEEKPIVTSDGKEDVGVFPVFTSEIDVCLPDELLQASDREQFDYCNGKLKEAVENDPELAKKFTPEQIEQIQNGETPDGYTWHHNEETGKMQLVDSDVHAKTGHTGGRTIWGGGSECR